MWRRMAPLCVVSHRCSALALLLIMGLVSFQAAMEWVTVQAFPLPFHQDLQQLFQERRGSMRRSYRPRNYEPELRSGEDEPLKDYNPSLRVGAYYKPPRTKVSGVPGNSAPFKRSPCPGLNALANHGYINRNGADVSVSSLIAALDAVYNVDPELSMIVVAGAKKLGAIADMNSFALSDLSKHNAAEHDASLVHNDAYLGGDPSAVNASLVKSFLSLSADGKTLRAQELALARKIRFLESKKQNPEFAWNPMVSTSAFHEAALILHRLGKEGVAKVSDIRTFLLDEQLPPGFSRPQMTLTLSRLQSAATMVAQQLSGDLSLPSNDPATFLRGFQLAVSSQGITYSPRAGISPTIHGSQGLIIAEAEYAQLMGELLPFYQKKVLPSFLLALSSTATQVPKSLKDYLALYEFFGDVPELNRHDFTSDELFARQFFTSYPHLLQKATAVPEGFTDANLQLAPSTLETLLGSGRLYIADLSYLRVIKPFIVPGRAMGNPIALFQYSPNEDGALSVLGIQVEVPGGLVFSPRDSANDWLLSKIFFNSAAIQEQNVDHFVSSHIALEPIKVALYRTMAKNHPVRALLEFYTKILFGNSLAAFRLLYPSDSGTRDRTNSLGAAGSQLLTAIKFQGWTWQKDMLDLQIQTRGLSDILPSFDYFVDALAITGATKRFITDYLKVYYPSDSAVAGDQELQKWAAETGDPGKVKGFPSSFTTVDDLSSHLAHFVHLCTTRHHAMNAYNPFQLGMTVPFQTPSIGKAIPSTKGEVTNIVEWLPPYPVALDVILTGLMFARPMTPDQVFYDGLRSADFNNAATASTVTKFMKSLAAISKDINKRADEDNVLPYRLLDPKRMPHYVFI